MEAVERVVDLQKNAEEGEQLLRDAVLHALFRVSQLAIRGEQGLERGEIHQALGLTRGEQPYPHTLTRAILALLEQGGLVKRVDGKPREWTLTPEGFAIAELEETSEGPAEPQTAFRSPTH